jgi:hypothetical protein
MLLIQVVEMRVLLAGEKLARRKKAGLVCICGFGRGPGRDRVEDDPMNKVGPADTPATSVPISRGKARTSSSHYDHASLSNPLFRKRDRPEGTIRLFSVELSALL